ncbi:MAG: 30S ribosomal protein S5 [Verrucomicrobia bacterium]|nr:30S ribosomal protein S5 [Verrucomicrobiota bacterium]MDA1085730.1 30S ribosomal protein S5 [Verrucomicrobiota bacterium]
MGKLQTIASREGAKDEFEERVVFVNRCSKVVKGGRRFSFSAVVVVGNRSGLVGYGFGKANEVAEAIRKSGEIARRSLQSVQMKGGTIPHEVTGVCDGGHVYLRPACPGTGVIAGGGARVVLELSGVHDVLAKSLGSNNKLNVVKATLNALQQLRSREEVRAIRSVGI